jgi:hypothetical protein
MSGEPIAFSSWKCFWWYPCRQFLLRWPTPHSKQTGRSALLYSFLGERDAKGALTLPLVFRVLVIVSFIGFMEAGLSKMVSVPTARARKLSVVFIPLEVTGSSRISWRLFAGPWKAFRLQCWLSAVQGPD